MVLIILGRKKKNFPKHTNMHTQRVEKVFLRRFVVETKKLELSVEEGSSILQLEESKEAILMLRFWGLCILVGCLLRWSWCKTLIQKTSSSLLERAQK
jgi:hypothetical protein